MRRILKAINGLVTAAASAGMLIGLPLALIATVGNPLPTAAPTVDDISWHLTNGRIPDAFWFGLFASLLWFVWFQLVIAFVVELTATMRGVTTPSLRGFGAAQSLVGPIVGRAALVTAILGSTPAAAGALSLPVVSSFPSAVAESASDVVLVGTTALSSDPSEILGEQGQDMSSPTQTVEVARRDTLRTLAQTHLGSASEWKDLRDANVGRVMADGTQFSSDTIQIKAGWTLVLPAGVTGAQVDDTPNDDTPNHGDRTDTGSDGVGQGSVEVVEDDHFWSLAEKQMADAWGRAPSDSELAPYWIDMVEANLDRLAPPEDPNMIYPGQTFVIPPVPADPLSTESPSLSVSADAPLRGGVTLDNGPTSEPVEPVQEMAPVEAAVPQAAPVEMVAPVTEAKPVEEMVPVAAATADTNDGVLDAELTKKVALGTVGAFTLSLLVLTLRRLSRRRSAMRAAGTERETMTLREQEIDDQVRALSDDGEAARYVAALNPWLSHALSDTGFLPSVLAVRAGSFGLELLLDSECAMPEQFVALGDNGKAWRLASSVSERDMKRDAGTAEPYCPALIPVGETSSGQLLLDFEQIGAVSVTGPAEDRDGFLREIVLGAMAAPWTKDCEIVVIGVPDINPMPGSRLVSPTDPVAWAHAIAKSVARDAKEMTSSPYEGRVEGVVEGHPTIVVVGSEFAAVAQHLAGAAMLARSSLTLIAGSELTSEARIVLTGTNATLEPSGLRWDLRTVNDIDVKMVDGLMTDAEVQQAEPKVEPVVSVTQPEQVVTSPLMVELIESIMAPCGVEVKTLRSEPVVEGVKLQAKLGAVTTYIALNPGVSAKKVKAVFWPEDTTRAAENAFGKIRRILGETEDGGRRFAKGTEFKFRGVGSDWQRFNALVEAANSTSAVVDQAAALDVALRLISGEPAKDVRGVLWSWFIDDRERYETMSALIVDAAVMRARLALEAEDALAARFAVRSGERAVPDSEALKQVSLQATKALEGNEKLDDEYRAALADAEERGYDLSSGTHRLYNVLRAQPDLRSVPVGTIVLSEAAAV